MTARQLKITYLFEKLRPTKSDFYDFERESILTENKRNILKYNHAKMKVIINFRFFI